VFLAGGAVDDRGGYKSGCLNLSGNGGVTRTRMYLKCTWEEGDVWGVDERRRLFLAKEWAEYRFFFET
jgi:hypothetical protein